MLRRRLSSNARRRGWPVVVVAVAVLGVAGCSASPTAKSPVTGATTSPPSKQSAPSLSGAQAALMAAKVGVEAFGSADCARLDEWERAALAVTTDFAAQRVRESRYMYAESPDLCPGRGAVTVTKMGFTSRSGSQATVVVAESVRVRGKAPAPFAEQVVVEQVAGRWLLGQDSESRPPLSGDISWAGPALGAAMQSADAGAAAMYAPSATGSPPRGVELYGAAAGKYAVTQQALRHWMTTSDTKHVTAGVLALGVELPPTANPVILVAVGISDDEHPGNGEQAILQLTMTHVGAGWGIANYTEQIV